jgi:hypothetical protein
MIQFTQNLADSSITQNGLVTSRLHRADAGQWSEAFSQLIAEKNRRQKATAGATSAFFDEFRETGGDSRVPSNSKGGNW